MRLALLGLPLIALMSAAQDTRTFTGTISDEICGRGDHSQMRMGSTDAECARACVESHGTSYVLFDGTTVYGLAGSQKLDAFAGRRVHIVGVLDAMTLTITMNSITPAQ
jgi:hypothetical protein